MPIDRQRRIRIVGLQQMLHRFERRLQRRSRQLVFDKLRRQAGGQQQSIAFAQR